MHDDIIKRTLSCALGSINELTYQQNYYSMHVVYMEAKLLPSLWSTSESSSPLSELELSFLLAADSNPPE